ncbi:MAG TPA: hypothetical protein VM163_06375 [bacterium]|nr:hypothetical protein [bacterium]
MELELVGYLFLVVALLSLICLTLTGVFNQDGVDEHSKLDRRN